jgi:hypothetical protein
MSRTFPALVLIVAATGCGTMRNLEGRQHYGGQQREWAPPQPFGGVGNDARWLGETVADVDEVLDVPGAVVTCAFILVDMPLSLVGDVITLPRTLSGNNQPRATLGTPSQPGPTPLPRAGEGLGARRAVESESSSGPSQARGP